METRFGALLKNLRIEAGFGLRRFADLIEMQPSNLSALENGRRPPPTEEDKLTQIASALGLADGCKEWFSLFDAAKREGGLPADVQHMANRKMVPALLRTIENCQLTDEQLGRLVKEIEERYRR